MKIFGRKVRIANASIRRKKGNAFMVNTNPKTKPVNETQPPEPQQLRLSPLSTLISQFIFDNALKTHDSIKDEKERRDFVVDLCETLKLVRDGKERSVRKSLSPTSCVIDFFAETTKSTLDSIKDKEERIGFAEHLTRALRQTFQHEMMGIQ